MATPAAGDERVEIHRPDELVLSLPYICLNFLIFEVGLLLMTIREARRTWRIQDISR
jgi:hypothetical protein